ncbi:hypothetical protein [Sphingomonas crusticola]|uniref:hypothetical protein n=1 Tax=Sphingomonas crusticola TaxID=1697973 RepID=UPI0013C2DBD9|nr:hypothetical protein [Sphingomonas crusticola]
MTTASKSDDHDAMTLVQIYLLLDARARDQRAIMLAFFAGALAAISAAMLGATGGNTAMAVYGALVTVVLAFLTVGRQRQVKRTIERAERVRLNLLNHADVPPIDVDLPRIGSWASPLGRGHGDDID